MKVVGFPNLESFHCYQWIVRNLDLAKLISQAYAKAEKSEFNHVDFPLCWVVVDELSQILEEAIGDLEWDWFWDKDIETDYPAIGDCEDGERYGSVDDLFVPILREGVHNIDFGRIARAILEKEKKWFPEEFKEMFPLPGEPGYEEKKQVHEDQDSISGPEDEA